MSPNVRVVTPAFLRSSLMSSSMYLFSARLRCAAGPGEVCGVLIRLGVGVGAGVGVLTRVGAGVGVCTLVGAGVLSGLMVGVGRGVLVGFGLVGSGVALAASASCSGMIVTSIFRLTHWRSSCSTPFPAPPVTAPLKSPSFPLLEVGGLLLHRPVGVPDHQRDWFVAPPTWETACPQVQRVAGSRRS